MSELPPGGRRAGVVARTARRIAVALAISSAGGLVLLHGWNSPPSALFLRTTILGLTATAGFALFEVWPRTLPRWIQRWVLQVVSVGVSMPVTTLLVYVLSTPEGAPPFWRNQARLDGWLHLTALAILIAPWTTLAAIVRQKEAIVREQQLTFALE